MDFANNVICVFESAERAQHALGGLAAAFALHIQSVKCCYKAVSVLPELIPDQPSLTVSVVSVAA